MNTKGIAGRLLREDKSYEEIMSEAAIRYLKESNDTRVLYSGELESFISEEEIEEALNTGEIIHVGNDLYVIRDGLKFPKLFDLYNFNSFCISDDPVMNERSFTNFHSGSMQLFYAIYCCSDNNDEIPHCYNPLLIKELLFDLPFDLRLANGKTCYVNTVEMVVELLDGSRKAIDKIKNGMSIVKALEEVYRGSVLDDQGLSRYNSSPTYFEKWSTPTTVSETTKGLVCIVSATHRFDCSEAEMLNTMKENKDSIIYTIQGVLRDTGIVVDIASIRLLDVSFSTDTISFKLLVDKTSGM